MRKYHDKLEVISDRIRKEGKFRMYRENLGAYASYYAPDVLAELQAYLDQAKNAVSDKKSPVYQRIISRILGSRTRA